MESKRIGVLDSYRFLAILLVIGYHYYARWTPTIADVNLYPYGPRYSNLFTKEGVMGVSFFFIISGFVIYFSILRCHSFGDFFKKRFIRLFPPLLLCSLITFFSVRLLDPSGSFPHFQNTLAEFLPSLTFTDNYLWAKILHHPQLGYIDSAYWSLVVEVKFYLLAGIIYFLLRDKERFIRRWTILLIVVVVICEINRITFIPHLLPERLVNFIKAIFFYEYILFFSLGIYFYDYFSKATLRVDYLVPVALLALYLHRHLWIDNLFTATFIFLFLCLIYNNVIVKLLDVAPLRRIGIATYTIYLLHQNIGVVLIAKYDHFSSQALMTLFPIGVFILFIIVSLLIYQYYELPSKRVLSKLLFRHKKQ